MKQRILSAIVIFAIVIPLIYLGGRYFSLGICLVSMLAFKELLNLKYNTNKIPILIQIFGFILTVLLVLTNDLYSYSFGISYRVLIGILIAFLIPMLFYNSKNYNSKDALYMVGITLLIGVTFNCFILVRVFNMWEFIYLLVIPILTDTFAMLFGLLCGKHKLCPTISPKKSWEGSIGGSIVGTIGASVFYHFLVNPINIKVILITLALSVVGQLGDLVFSRIKRDNETKDYSNLIPGHGGILDRLDSIIFVVITYVLIHSFI